jgi:hypothetical protein
MAVPVPDCYVRLIVRITNHSKDSLLLFLPVTIATMFSEVAVSPECTSDGLPITSAIEVLKTRITVARGLAAATWW